MILTNYIFLYQNGINLC